MRYATRSLWRNKRRTVLTIGTVTLSAMVSVIGSRYSTAVLKIWEDGAIDHGVSHAQIHVVGYYDKPDVMTDAILLREGNKAEELLSTDPEVETWARRLIFEGIMSAGSKTVYFLGRGVDSEKEFKVSPKVFQASVDKGEFVTNDKPEQISVGDGLAGTLGVNLNDDVTIMAHTLAGTVNGMDARLTGIVHPPIKQISKRLAYLDIGFVQRSIGAKGKYSEIAIRLKPGVDPEKWVARVKPEIDRLNLDLRGWWQIDPMIRNVEKIWDSVVGVISLLLFISAGISVLNIVFMLVAERTVEIGTLGAIGAKARDIRNLFTLEASLIGTIGGIIGTTLGNIALVIMDLVGVPFDSPFSSGDLYVHPKVSFGVTMFVFAAAVAICYIAALAPARKASRVEPVVAFRGQIT